MIPFPHAMVGQGVSVTYTATAWLFPTSMSNRDPGVGTAWGNPGNIGADDGSNATCILSGSGQGSQYLRASNFNFAGQSIPSEAVITGIEARIAHYQTDAGVISDLDVYLADYTDNDPLSLSRGKYGAAWPTSEVVQDYGAQNDTWGLTLTKALLETTTFALLLRCWIPGSGSSVGTVDYVQLRAHYYF